MYNSKGFLVPPLLFAPLTGIEKICKWDAVAKTKRNCDMHGIPARYFCQGHRDIVPRIFEVTQRKSP